jgi:hypothetical protein
MKYHGEKLIQTALETNMVIETAISIKVTKRIRKEQS